MKDEKEPLFNDEYSEPCFPVSRVASALMVLGAFIGLVLLIAALWLSRGLAHFLKTGAF